MNRVANFLEMNKRTGLNQRTGKKYLCKKHTFSDKIMIFGTFKLEFMKNHLVNRDLIGLNRPDFF